MAPYDFEKRIDAMKKFSEEEQAKARAARKKAPTRKQKMASYAETFAKQRKRFPKMALPIIDQCEQGKLQSFVKLMCLECSHWVRQEVRDCVIPWCPLFPIRPFQKMTSKNPNDPPPPRKSVDVVAEQGVPHV
jgi:rubrerythrin